MNASRSRHGKVAEIAHDGLGRYHSLALAEHSLPEELAVTARSEDGEIMGIRHRTLPIEGIQYHPESILTTTGKRQLANFLDIVREHRRAGR